MIFFSQYVNFSLEHDNEKLHVITFGAFCKKKQYIDLMILYNVFHRGTNRDKSALE